MKTLKAILDQVNGEAGFDVPNRYFQNPDPNIVQLIAIANRSAITLRDLRLQYLVRTGSIDLDGGAATADSRIKSYPLPDDFYALVPDTTYQLGRIDAAQMPTDAPVWSYLTSRTGSAGIRVRCRFIAGRLEVFSPEAGQSLSFEYISSYTIRGVITATSTDNTLAATFAADSDTWLLDDALIELDIKWRYKREKGFDWQADFQDFTLYTNELRARDAGSRTIGWPREWPYPNEPFANLWVQ